MKTIKALLSVRLWADCPHCDKQLDLMDSYYNDDGQFYNLVFNSNFERENLDVETTCAECGEEFKLTDIEW